MMPRCTTAQARVHMAGARIRTYTSVDERRRPVGVRWSYTSRIVPIFIWVYLVEKKYIRCIYRCVLMYEYNIIIYRSIKIIFVVTYVVYYMKHHNLQQTCIGNQT